jgi:formylglycine-generating enzyme required for sulfatase activity
MRLPTSGEWIYIAAGRLGHRYPWGHNKQKSVANTLGLGVARPLPVGTFEAGRGPFGTYDQIGNLEEWTTDWVPGSGDPVGLDEGFVGEAGGGLTEGQQPFLSAMGGSYTSRQRPLFLAGAEVPLNFFARSLTREHRSREVGVRCVAEAESYLSLVASDLGDSADSRHRLRAIGERWHATGEGAVVEMLERLIAGPGSAAGFKYLLEGARP